MATFREIDEAIMALVDDEGEILDVEAFEQLQMERTKKAENMGKWIQKTQDDQLLIKKEIDRLTKLKRSAERKEERLKEYLRIILGGETLKTPALTISFRNTPPTVEIDDEEAVRKFAMSDDRYEDILKYKEPEISRTEIRRLIAEGVNVPGARMVSWRSTVIK